MNIVPKDRQIQILHLLCEGNSLRSTARLTRTHKDTCRRLMVRFGQACQKFHEENVRDLTLEHIQLDEMWTFVRKKEKNVTGKEPDAAEIGDAYIWLAIDETTKLIPAFLVGKRTEGMAKKFLLDLASRLYFPTAHDSDDHAYEDGSYPVVTRISSGCVPRVP